MDFLWSLFEPVVTFLQVVLEFFHRITGMLGCENYGLTIILLTVVIKIILYPLTVKQVKSMKAMQDLQPEMKRIQKNYKNNPQLQQQEIAKLYREAGVNPLAGCLPLFAQMPILMGMYYALRDFTYIGDPRFLWLPSLSVEDPFYILPILAALMTYVQQKQTTTEMNQQMKMMMIFMPLFFGWVCLNLPSGVVLYYVVNGVVQVIQQWWMYRGEGDAKKGAA